MFDFANPGYEIIDAHVHPYSLRTLNIPNLCGGTPEENFVYTLKGAGISRAAGSVIARKAPGTEWTWEAIHAFNTKALEGRDSTDGFLIPGICVHPVFPEESLAEIEYMYHKENVRFIGELVAYMMNYRDYARSEMMPMWDLANLLTDMNVATIRGYTCREGPTVVTKEKLSTLISNLEPVGQKHR